MKKLLFAIAFMTAGSVAVLAQEAQPQEPQTPPSTEIQATPAPAAVLVTILVTSFPGKRLPESIVLHRDRPWPANRSDTGPPCDRAIDDGRRGWLPPGTCCRVSSSADG